MSDQTDSQIDDHIDEVMRQWHTACPSIDPTPMQLPARIQRLAREIDGAISTNLAHFGFERWQLDVLSTLRRADRPLTAGELCAGSMISGSAMTNRVDKLATAGLLTRATNPDNRRCVRITLTDEGRQVVDQVLPTHLDVCRQLLARLDDAEQQQLDYLLRKAFPAAGA